MNFRSLSDSEAKEAIELLEREYKDAKYYLNFSTPVDLMVAAILSAQTHDEVVNAATPELFKHYKTARDYADADSQELMRFVKTVSFSGNKAKNIISACKIIEEKHRGRVPNTIEGLTELPGIGRKTANTILINAYGIVEGIPVDTWVIKLSYRIGLSKNTNPEKIEQDLMRITERKYWKNLTYVMKAHGKKMCQSQVPICSKCLIGPESRNKLCPRNGVPRSA